MNAFIASLTPLVPSSNDLRRYKRVLFGFIILLTAWIPASLAQAADAALPGYEIIPLGRGHNNRLCLAGTIGGIKGLLLLDTGANATALSETTYRPLLAKGTANLPSGQPKSVEVNGMACPVAMAPDFRVGKANLGTLPVCLVPRRYLYDRALASDAATDRLYDGLLGENLLRHYHAVVDCERLVLYLNTNPTKRVSFKSSLTREGAVAVPMTDIGNDFTVPCTIDGHHFRLIVDTGAPFTDANRRLVDALHLQSSDLPMLRSGLIGTRAEEVGIVTVDGMQIGNYTVPRIHILTSPQSYSDFGGPRDESKEGAIIGLLGCDALAANAAVIDVGNKVLYLKRIAGGKR